MSIVRDYRPTRVEAPRGSSDLRAIDGLIGDGGTGAASGARSHSHEELRIARVGDTVVGVCRIAPEVMRLGESRLKVGAITDLRVHAQFDAHAVREALFEDALAYLAEHRYHLALATGPELLLRRFGFSEAFTPSVWLLPHPSEDRPSDASGLKLRKIKPGDIGAVQRMYSMAYQDSPGSLLHSRARLARMWDQYANSIVLTNGDGRALAYVVSAISEGNLRVHEMAWSDGLRPEAMRAQLWSLAEEADCFEIHLCGPPRVMAALGGTRAGSHHHHSHARGYLRAIDIEELLQSMVPEWESACGDLTAELTLMVGEPGYRLRCWHGAVSVERGTGQNKVSASPSEFLRLLLGIDDIERFLGSQRRLLTAEAEEFLRNIFPARDLFISAVDLG